MPLRAKHNIMTIIEASVDGFLKKNDLSHVIYIFTPSSYESPNIIQDIIVSLWYAQILLTKACPRH